MKTDAEIYAAAKLKLAKKLSRLAKLKKEKGVADNKIKKLKKALG